MAAALVLVENAVMEHFEDAGQVTESTRGTKVAAMIGTVASRSVAKAFQSSTLKIAV